MSNKALQRTATAVAELGRYVKTNMNLENIKEVIKNWARSEPLVKKAYIFGSRIRNDYKKESDLDVAIEIEQLKGDEDTLTTWACESKRMREVLQKNLPFQVQLEFLEKNETPTVKKGVEASSVLVYSKE